jgi:galactan 5-O-arabinofuranosyltransferase
VVLEIAVAFVVCAAFVASCVNIHVNPLDRLGQVSAIASVELRFLWFALPLFVALAVAAKWREGVHFSETTRFVCAAFAGISSAAVAGGIFAALGHSKYGLGGLNGDSGVLVSWAEMAKRGQVGSVLYPPLQVEMLVWLSELIGRPTAYAMKWFQIVGIAVVGPLSYSMWRLLLRPAWALGIGVVAALPLVEAYRQYPLLTLILFIPLSLKYLDVIRNCTDEPVIRLLRHGALYGLAFGVLFLLYSGWFQWSGPGLVVAAIIVAPWRRGWKPTLIVGAVSLIVFTIISYRYLTAVAATISLLKDDFVYFDATVEPTYIAMWRGGLPGNVGVWPPIGELGGVGLFTVLLAVGTGASIIYARTRTVVIGLGSIMVGTWLFRLWHAHNMWKTKLVQLYPRTTAELLYCALLLSAFAIYFAVERVRERGGDSLLVKPTSFIGVFASLVFLVMSASAATIDKYMPRDAVGDPGNMAWISIKTPPLEASQTMGAVVDVSSSDERPPEVAASYLIDRKFDRGFSSALGKTEDHEEWIVIRMPTGREFRHVVIAPAPDGFPVDFTLEVWDGAQWLVRVKETNYPQPTTKQTFDLGRMEGTPQFRLRATKLRKVGNDYVLKLNEIELYR